LPKRNKYSQALQGYFERVLRSRIFFQPAKADACPLPNMAASLNNRTQANGGALRVAASQTSGNAPRQATAKPPTPKLKVIIRRLAPGLTREEFITSLGDEWQLEQGKVDWFLYKPGKDSKEYRTLLFFLVKAFR
jgi:Smg-4/UPF3 family